MSNHAYNQSAFCVLNFDLRLRTQDLWSIQDIQKNQNMSQVSSKKGNRWWTVNKKPQITKKWDNFSNHTTKRQADGCVLCVSPSIVWKSSKVDQKNQTEERLLQHCSCQKQSRLEGESCRCWRTHLRSPLNNINAEDKNTIFNVCAVDL
jgi:hypothetical protein